VSTLYFVRYALENVFRNKRRSLFAVLGIVLALALIGGENIAIDSIITVALKEELAKEPVDFVGTAYYSEDYENITKTISTVSYVTRVEPIYYGLELTGLNPLVNLSEEVFLVGVKPEFREVLDKFGITKFTGNFELEPNTTAIHSWLASELELTLGDTIQIFSRYIFFDDNKTARKTINLTVSCILHGKEGYYDYNIERWLWVNLSEAPELCEELEDGVIEIARIPLPSTYYYYKEEIYRYFIWIDRSKVINPVDPDGTINALNQLERKIEFAGSIYGLRLENKLVSRIQSYTIELMWYRILFIAVGLPVMGLGFYLSLLGIDLGMNYRRNEIAILKTRGASNKQIYQMLLVEAIILGILAGVLGLLAGILVCTILLRFVQIPGLSIPEAFILPTISWVSILICMLFGIFLIFFAALKPTKRIANLQPIEGLRVYSTEEAKERYSPKRDAILLGLGIAIFAGIICVAELTKVAIYAGGFFFVFMIVGLCCFAAPVLLPFAPFALIFGLTNLLTRSTNKIYLYVSKLTKFFTKDLWYLISRNIARNPKRASRVCVIIALGVAFGVFISVMFETELAYQERLVKAEIGSDILVDTSSTNLTFAEELSEVEGIEKLCIVSSKSVTIIEEHITVIGFNSSTYYSIVKPEQFYFTQGEPKTAISALEDKNTIIDRNLANRYGLSKGDSITIYANGEPETYKIVGIVRVLPGLTIRLTRYWGPENCMFIDISNFNLTPETVDNYRFLVKVEKGYSHREVAESIEEKPEVVSVRILAVELEEARKDPGGFLSLLLLQYAFVILIIVVGLGIIMLAATLERERELADIIARGATRSQIALLLLGEAFTIILLGLIIGVGAGIFTAFVFITAFSALLSGFVGFMGMPIERVLTISWLTIKLVLFSFIMLLFTAFLASVKASRLTLYKALRIRGG
jgi:putative ABC transport system permease protein